MRFLKISLGAIYLIAAVPPTANAAIKGVDLENCRYKDGSKITQPFCEKLRLSDERTKSRPEGPLTDETTRAELQRQDDERHAAEKMQIEERSRVVAEQRARDDTEREARQVHLKAEQKKAWAEQAQYERAELVREKKQAADLKDRKQACGNDFASPKIGMTLGRAQQCIGKFKLISQINRADGVLSTYTTGTTYIHVMGNQIVSWGR